jgi:hypothetical protein
MSVNGPPPELDTSVSLYHRLWKTFGDASFSAAAIPARLEPGEDEPPRSVDTAERALDRLVAAGLVRRIDESRYQIRCKPGESAVDWHAALGPHIEAIHRRIHASEPDTDSLADGDERADVLSHGGEAYVAIPVDEDTAFPALVARLARLVARDTPAGVVLQARATEAATVQAFADMLYDAAEMERLSCPVRFDKEYSVVVGEEKDALEYRLFLTPEPL